ncbi:MAG: hypothetical protein DMF97_02935 [Acidobacteria bacterium]|nr:MAG: hypothetical protein DMF97_02935 [Acidobacteriota bacterium]
MANPRNSGDISPDPQTMFEWLADLIDRYGQHAAYLRVAGSPVIFIYAASLLSSSNWTDVRARLRATGRDPLLIGDFSRSILLEPFDGEYQYTNVFLTGDALADLYRTESLRVRTYNLLREGDRRRLWVAPVTPGFNDSLLASRPTHYVVDRSNGSVYDEQWHGGKTPRSSRASDTEGPTWHAREYGRTRSRLPRERCRAIARSQSDCAGALRIRIS